MIKSKHVHEHEKALTATYTARRTKRVDRECTLTQGQRDES